MEDAGISWSSGQIHQGLRASEAYWSRLFPIPESYKPRNHQDTWTIAFLLIGSFIKLRLGGNVEITSADRHERILGRGQLFRPTSPTRPRPRPQPVSWKLLGCRSLHPRSFIFLQWPGRLPLLNAQLASHPKSNCR